MTSNADKVSVEAAFRLSMLNPIVKFLVFLAAPAVATAAPAAAAAAAGSKAALRGVATEDDV